MVRGTDKGNIFLDNVDRSGFLEGLAQNAGKKVADIVHEECLKHGISTEDNFLRSNIAGFLLEQ
jgi:hypothetical protein